MTVHGIGVAETDLGRVESGQFLYYVICRHREKNLTLLFLFYNIDRAKGARLKALPIANVTGIAMRVTRKNFINGPMAA